MYEMDDTRKLLKRINMKKMSIFGPGLNGMCRLCLCNDGQLIEIFSVSPKLRAPIANIVTMCASVHIKRTDQLPKHICKSCYHQLVKTHQFQSQIKQSDKTLRCYLKKLRVINKEIKPETSAKLSEKCVGKSFDDSEEHDVNYFTADANISTFGSDVEGNIIKDISCENQEETKFGLINKIAENDGTTLDLENIKVNSKPEVVWNIAKSDECFDSNGDLSILCEAQIDDSFDNEANIKQEPSITLINETCQFQSQIKHSERTSQCNFKKLRVNNKEIKPETSKKLSENCVDKIFDGSKKHDANYYDADASVSCKKQEETEFDFVDTTGECEKPEFDLTNMIAENDGTILDLEDSKVNSKPQVIWSIAKTDECFDSNADLNILCEAQINDSFETETNIKSTTALVNQTCMEIINNGRSHNQVTKKRKRKPIKPGSFHCNLCSKFFTRLYHLERHMLTHTGEKPFECNICNKCFTQIGSLNDHKRTHTGEKPYRCSVCDKHFTGPGNLYAHRLTHSNRQYQCDICNMSFKRQSNLNRHKVIHSGMRPYQCGVCFKCFSDPSTLRRHRLIHTGEKPYHCGVCNKGFNQSNALKRHKLTHIGEIVTTQVFSEHILDNLTDR